MRVQPIIWVALAAVLLAGCSRAEWAKLFGRGRDKTADEDLTPAEVVKANTTTVDWELRALNEKKVMKGTIGELASPDWLRPIPVSGYGLVAGLGKNGSRECPPRIREQLLKEIRRSPHLYQPINHRRMTAKQLLGSLDTGVVHIRGRIPPGAPYNEVFDVEVQALEGSKTRSLEGGVLLPAELQARGQAFPGKITPGRTLAVAYGPVFVNPFGRESDKPAATTANLRRGRVIGGGRNRYVRRVKLTLLEARYKDMARVAAVINEQFPADPPTADARSPQELVLRIPPRYRDRYRRFLALVTHLYVDDFPGYRMKRAEELVELALEREAPFNHIVLCWQGIGPPVLPVIQKLYNHENKPAAFWAAVTGLRLGDRLAAQVLAEFARDPGSLLRLRAVEELGDAPEGIRTDDILRPLLADADAQIRIAAYKALRKKGDYAIRSIPAGGGNFDIDVVDTKGHPLIFVSVTGQQRIVLFGKDLRVRPPVYYRHSEGLLTLSADERATQISAYRVSRVSGTGSEAKLPLEVVNLIETMAAETRVVKGQVVGLQLSYAHVVGAIESLCKSRAIRATFELERPRLSDLFGPVRLPEDVGGKDAGQEARASAAAERPG